MVPAPDFSLAATPATVSINAGGTAQTVSLTASAINGFSSAVTVTITGLPTGVTATPATLSLTPGTAGTVMLTASAAAAAGSATITFTGTSGALSHAATASLSVLVPPPPDFSVSISPTTLALSGGGAGGSVSVTASAINSFTGTVTVAISGLPAGVTANPTMLSLTPGTPGKVTLTAGAAAAAGTSTVTFTGTSGTLSHTATVALSISVPPDFSLTVSPTSLALTSGGAGVAVSLTASAINAFAGTVAVTISGLPAGVTASPSTLSLTPGTPGAVTLTAGAAAAAGNSTISFTGTSAGLSHTAMVTLTVAAPAPDFSLTLSPTSLSLAGGGAGGSASVTANAINAFTGMVAVTISGLPAGVTANPTTLSLTPGTAQSTTLTAASTAVAATATVTFTGTSGSLSHAAQLALTVQPEPLTNAPDVTTYHDDNARDGLNAAETILTLSNVNSTQFGKIGFDTVDGLVDAEPLYVANLMINGGLHNVLYVETEHDSVFAFDADSGTQLWKTSVLGSGETTSDDHNCAQITPEIGITSTPVIDRTQGTDGTLFTVAMSKDANGNYHHRLHALDLTTGAEISGSPTEISATYPGTGADSQNGNVIFDPAQYAERAALLLVNGNIYLTWTSHCDTQPYTGWVMAYSETTLQQTQVLNLTPNGKAGSIWMAGDGPAADSSGNIYLLDANGTFDLGFDSNGFPTMFDFGNGILKLSLNSSGTLVVSDFFEPYDTAVQSKTDTDLGSGGELLLPDMTDAAGNTHQLIVGAGKDANIYVGDRNNLGKFNSVTSDNSNLYQEVSKALHGGVFSTPAYFNGVLYYGAAFVDTLKAFPFTNAKLATAATSQSSETYAYPGTTPSISANGTQNGIVWALQSAPGVPAVLHAYDATNLGNELYNSNQAAGQRDSVGSGNKFVTPMIVNGKVYVGTQTGVAVFGLLSQ